MSFTDALTRISEIQQQITTLSASSTAAGGTAATTTGSSDSVGSSATSQFAQALAEAQLTDGASDSGTTTGSDTSELSALTGSDTSGLSGATGSDTSELSALLAAAGSGSAGSGDAISDVASPGSAAASSPASSELTSGQQQFASTLVADTGLNPNVVSAWLLAEESGGPAQTRQASNNNDWLNIGYTDSGTVGAGDTVWSDPVSAATATAGWLKGQDTIPGYGTASSGVQSILASVGQTPQQQISALQNSGWASSGYPGLDALYQQVTEG
jgi:hypothetical protein